jgi:pimeloyl-ACP methyl ester carboxylesterase
MIVYPLLCALALGAEPEVVQSRMVQVAPVKPAPTSRAGSSKPGKTFTRSKGQERAVVLIHGFRLYFRDEDIVRPHFHGWQMPGSVLVKDLAREADVFAFSYGQNASVADIVEKSSLRANLARLKKLGYGEVVVIAHSAGGLVARRLVEDHPDCGVTKVIQVCCPNAGTPSAGLTLHTCQQPFLDCLSVEGRARALKERADVHIPAKVQFVCFIALGGLGLSDGVVPCPAQWPADLRTQGVPAVAMKVSHRSATRGAEGARAIARLVREDQPRWPRKRAEELAQELFRGK